MPLDQPLLSRQGRQDQGHADRVTVKIFSFDRAYTFITSPSIGKTTCLHPDLKRGRVTPESSWEVVATLPSRRNLV